MSLSCILPLHHNILGNELESLHLKKKILYDIWIAPIFYEWKITFSIRAQHLSAAGESSVKALIFDPSCASPMEHTRVKSLRLYGRDTLSCPSLWLFDDYGRVVLLSAQCSAEADETDAHIARIHRLTKTWDFGSDWKNGDVNELRNELIFSVL